jgi:tetratricopeptide (TPR) repeat protein
MSQAAADLELALEQLIPEEQEENIQQARVEVLTELRALHHAAEDLEKERVVVLELATVLRQRGEGSGGIDTLASWLRVNPSDIDVAVRLGEMATVDGDHSAAVFAYERLVRVSEGGARTQAVLLLADAAVRAGSPLDARGALEEAFSENPSDESLRSHLRAMYEAGGEFHELAQILLAEADKSEDPDTRAALFVDVGDLYLKADNGEAACSVYEQALEITASPYPVTSKLAEAYLSMGEVKRADEILTEAVRVHGKRRSPELSILQATLAKVAQAMGNEDSMFAWLEAALMSDRNNADVASVLAEKAQEQGRFDIAVKALQSLTLSKSEGTIGKAEAYFRQAQIAQAQGDPKKALLMARRASSADGSLPGVVELLGELGASA